MFIDSHAHLYLDGLKPKLDQVLENAKTAGVGTIINVGVDIQSSQKALRQTQQAKNSSRLPRCKIGVASNKNNSVRIFSTIGIHPHNADVARYTTSGALEKDIGQLKNIFEQNPDKVVAVGECGLDFFFEKDSHVDPQSGSPRNDVKSLQLEVFKAQIELSKDLNLPIIIHCRDAWPEMLPLLSGLTGVLHCYSGNKQITAEVLKTSLYVSFAGNLTFPKNEYLRQSLKLIPMERILIETDSPFLSPQTKRGQINEPANVIEVAQLIAAVKGVSFERVASLTSDNAKALFRL